MYKQVYASESEKKSTEIELKDLKLKIRNIDQQKDKHEEQLSTAIQLKSDQVNADQKIVLDVKKKTEDLKLFSDLLSSSIKQIVVDLNIEVDDKDKLEPRLL